MSPLAMSGKTAPSVATLYIFGVGNGFQVERVNASSIGTEMVNLKTFGDLCYKKFVTHPMRPPVISSSLFPMKESPITTWIHSTIPNPTSTRCDIELRKKPIQ
jgi:hypothetical protein